MSMNIKVIERGVQMVQTTFWIGCNACTIQSMLNISCQFDIDTQRNKGAELIKRYDAKTKSQIHVINCVYFMDKMESSIHFELVCS